MELKYRIVNTTVKPARFDARGTDLRGVSEKVGHAISFRNEQDKPIIVYAGKQTLVSKIDSGLLGLQRGGFIKIEQIKDVTAVLEDHILKPKESKPRVRAKAISSKVRAVEMGKDDYKEGVGEEYDGAVNPDGDPNFLVKADRVQKRKRRNVPNAASLPTNGESEEVFKVIS